jgi:sarcosine oxidase subunit gamma
MHSGMELERIRDRTLVSLRVHRADAEKAQRALGLAEPQNSTGNRIRSLWIGPNHWLQVSDVESAAVVIGHCTDALGDVLHHAVDQSAALVSFRFEGQAARSILEAGCGIDLRPSVFPTGAVRRTRLAQVAVILIAIDEATFEVVLDRSLTDWLQQWLTDTIETLRAYN